MDYVCFQRFKNNGIDGYVNIPATSNCTAVDDFIYYSDKKICYIKSQNAYDYFSRNDDGNGMIRGPLAKKIVSKWGELGSRQSYLLTIPEESRADDQKVELEQIASLLQGVMGDAKCQPYKRADHDDVWLWNFDFYNAPLEDLEYIAAKIEVKA